MTLAIVLQDVGGKYNATRLDGQVLSKPNWLPTEAPGPPGAASWNPSPAVAPGLHWPLPPAVLPPHLCPVAYMPPKGFPVGTVVSRVFQLRGACGHTRAQTQGWGLTLKPPCAPVLWPTIWAYGQGTVEGGDTSD